MTLSYSPLKNVICDNLKSVMIIFGKYSEQTFFKGFVCLVLSCTYLREQEHNEIKHSKIKAKTRHNKY